MTEEFDTDTQIAASAEHLAETVCAMSNSCGGRVEYDGQVVTVHALNWYRKPITHNGCAYRRIEGENVISGRWARAIMANRDFSRDDFPASDKCELDGTQLEAFREAVTSRHEGFRHFTHDEFLRRVGICSGKYLTFAGELLFGNAVNICAVLQHNAICAEIFAHNIWSAYTDMLPRLTYKLSGHAAQLMREAFVNALLHSDYKTDTHINITITSNPPRAIIDNPGLVRGDIRNHRLKRMFDLAGMSHTHTGEITLRQDMLNFRTSTTIPLEGMPQAVIL